MSFYSSVLPLTALLAGLGIATVPSPASAAIVPAGTPVTIRLAQPLGTQFSPPGSRFSGTLMQPVMTNGKVVLPRGTQVFGTVVKSRRSGRLRGRAEMALRLDSIQAFGRRVPVVTTASVRGPGSKRRNLRWIGGAAAGGTVIGAIAGGGAGALVGAGVGAAGGAAGAAGTRGRNLTLPAETPLTFTLAKPVPLK